MFDRVVTALLKNAKTENIFDIKDYWLFDKEPTQFQFIKDYVINYRELPSIDVFNNKFKTSLPVPCGRLAHEIMELRERYIRLKLTEEIPKKLITLKNKPSKTLLDLQELLSGMDSSNVNKDLRYDAKASERWEEYKKRLGTNGVIHLSTGVPAFDGLFYGYYPTDLITVGGRSGLGKSWLCCLMALFAESVMEDFRGPILFLSNELSHEEINGRFDSLRFKLPYSDFLKGKLDRKTQIRYRTGLEELEEKGSKIIILDDCYTMDDVRKKVFLYNPSLLYVDGSYMLEPQMEEDWKKLVFITRNLKKIAKDNQVPIFNTTQLKRGSGTKQKRTSYDVQDEFSWSSSYSQDSDLALAAYQTPQMQYHHKIGLQVAKGRRVEPGTEIIWENDLNACEYKFTLNNTNDTDEEDEDEQHDF